MHVADVGAGVFRRATVVCRERGSSPAAMEGSRRVGSTRPPAASVSQAWLRRAMGTRRAVTELAIITEACIDVKDRACVDVCPVQCIYEYDGEEFAVL